MREGLVNVPPLGDGDGSGPNAAAGVGEAGPREEPPGAGGPTDDPEMEFVCSQ